MPETVILSGSLHTSHRPSGGFVPDPGFLILDCPQLDTQGQGTTTIYHTSPTSIQASDPRLTICNFIAIEDRRETT